MAEQLVVFGSAGELYALPLQAVREVVAAAPRRTLPTPPEPWVVGMASIRGDLMPVVDLSARMGGAPIAADEAAAGLFERDGRLVMVLRPAALLPDAGTAAPRRPRAPRSRPE